MGQVCGVPVPCASRAEARPARGDTAKGGVPTAEPKVACVEASSATAPHEVARERSDAAVSLGRASVASSTYFSAVDWAPDDEDDAEVLWARSVARRSSRAARRPSADEAQGGSGLGRDGKQRRASGCARAASLVESEELIEAFDVAHLGSSGALDALRDARECKRVLLARTLLRRLRDDLGGAAADAALEHAGLDADEIERDADEAERCNAALDDHTGWTAVRDDTLRCWYLHDEKQGAHCIKFQCILPHPLEKAVALLHEWDLIGSWNKMARDPCILKCTSRFECIGYFAEVRKATATEMDRRSLSWLPIPFRDVQVIFECKGADLLDENASVLAMAKTIRSSQVPKDAKPLPPAAKKRSTVLLLEPSAIRLRALPQAEDGTPRTEGFMNVHVDPRMKFVPELLIKFVLYVLAPYVFKEINKVLGADFGPTSPYSERIRKNSEVYAYARKRLGDCEASHPGIIARRDTPPEKV